MTPFKAVLADPPWQFKIWSDHARDGEVRSGSGFPTGKYKNARLAAAHYTVQESDWIAKLPIADVCDKNTVLFLWAVWPMLPEALQTISAWGFEYKTLGFDWIKTTSNGNPKFGMGYWTRANSEPCLLAARGKPKRLDKGVGQVIVSGLGEHSEKPEEIYSRIERLVEGPYLELFARPRHGLLGPRDGWMQLGNQVDGKDMRDALTDLAVSLKASSTSPEPQEPPARSLQCSPGPGRDEVG